MPSITYFTSESVCAGHPDKICDQVSDAIVDAALSIDSRARVAVETLVTANQVVLAGEVTVSQPLDFVAIARQQIARLGYTKQEYGFFDQSPIIELIHQQSSEISVGVDQEGAGDQGMMFGFACNDTKQLMPMPITLAHALARQIDSVRESKLHSYLRPDGKTQVIIKYSNGKPMAVEKVVMAMPHSSLVPLEQVSCEAYQQIVVPVLAEFGFKIDKNNVIINGTGVWHQGGPAADTGVTGRKIVVDTYGGYARVGGGCFSGKDPTKVDRSGAYAARYIAKNVVAQGLADRAEVALAYCIGKSQPVMKTVETFGTLKVSTKALNSFVSQLLDCSVSGIITALDLRKPIYLPTAAYGHFGKEDVSWEKIAEV